MRIYSFNANFTKYTIGSTYMGMLLTEPEQIYKSHYGNGGFGNVYLSAGQHQEGVVDTFGQRQSTAPSELKRKQGIN